MIGTITEGTSHKFCNVFVCEYAGLKSLSFPKEDGNIEKIDDIKEVTTDESDLTKSIDTDVTNAIISGIKHFSSYKSCSSCKGKMSLEGTNNKFVRCSKCSMIQKAEEAVDMYSATVEVKDTTSGQKLELYAFKEHLSTIANSSEFTDFDLLEADTFSLSFNAKYMITRVAKERLTSKLSSIQFNQTNTLTS